MYFAKSKKRYFWFAPPPTTRTGLLQTIPHPWDRRAGLVSAVARRGGGGGNRSNWTMHNCLYIKFTKCYVLHCPCKKILYLNVYLYIVYCILYISGQMKSKAVTDTFNLFRLIWFLQNPQVLGLHSHSVSRCRQRSDFFTNMPHSRYTQESLRNSQLLLVWACWKRYTQNNKWLVPFYIFSVFYSK